MDAPRPHYRTMVFPQPDGTFTMSLRISHAATGSHPGSQWTSPETPIPGATLEEASRNAQAQAKALHAAIEMDDCP